MSGPLLDRIDIQIEVDAVPVEDISGQGTAEGSRAVRERVVKARQIQLERFQGSGIRCNAQMGNREIEELALLSPEALRLLQRAMKQFSFSMRAYGRLIRLGRTVADLRGEARIEVSAMAEAIQYRRIDAKYWGASHV